MNSLVYLTWFFMFGGILLSFLRRFFMKEELKEKEGCPDKEYSENEKDIQKILDVLNSNKKMDDYESKRDAWLEAERFNSRMDSKEIDDFLISRLEKSEEE